MKSVNWLLTVRLLFGFSLFGMVSTPVNSFAYPQFVAHGYTTCGSCHYNPMGNGPLTDYGRAVGATLISGKAPWFDAKASDEQVANASGFLGAIALPFWLRPSIQIREMQLRTGIPDNTVSRWIEMEQEASIVLQSKDSKWIVSANYGHVPVPATAPKADASQYVRWVSRELYLGVRALKNVHFYAGLMDPFYGLRLAEHTSYVQAKALRNTYDQSYGATVHVHGKKWDLYLNPVIGNLQQEAPLRRKGFFATFEHETFERVRFGVSASSTKNDFQTRKMGSVFTRLGMGKNGAGLLGEFTLISDLGAGSDTSTLSQMAFLQATTVVARGVYFLMTVENYISDFKSGTNRYVRAGPAIQYFPFQRLEFRADFLGTRSVGNVNLVPDDYSLLAQVHVWL